MSKITDASGDFKQLKKRLEDIEASLRVYVNTTDKSTKSLDKQTKSVKNLDSNVRKGITGVRNLRNQTDQLTTSQKKNTNETEKATSSFARYNRVLSIVRSRLLIVAFSMKLVKDSVGALARLTEIQHVAELKLNAVLESTGHAARLGATELRNMANQLSKTSLISDDLIIDAQSIMLTFTKIGRDTFPEALKQATNMSLVFGQDLKQSVIQVGKALNDPVKGISALKRIGVSFSEVQKEQIENFMETNDLASAQKVILEELAMEMGGVAEKMANTPLSGWKQGWIDVKDSLEGLGSAILNILTPVEWLWKKFGAGMKAFDEFDKRVTGETAMKEYAERVALAASENERLALQLQRVAKEVMENTGRAFDSNSKELQHLRSNIILTLREFRQGNIDAESFAQTMNLFSQMIRQLGIDAGATIVPLGELVNTMKGDPQYLEYLRALNDEMTKLSKTSAIALARGLGGGGLDFGGLDAIAKAQEKHRQQGTLDSEIKLQEAILSTKQDFYSQLGEMSIQFLNEEIARNQTAIRQRLSDELKSLRASRAYKRANDDQKLAMEKKLKDSANKDLKDQHKIQQGVAIAGIVFNAAQAIMKSMALFPVTGGQPFVSMIGVMAALQSSLVLAQKPPIAAARGANFVTDGPQMMLVGDNPGGRERVQVTPLSSPNIDGPAQGGAINVTISGNVMSQDFVEGELAEQIKTAIRRGTDFGIS